ncbi:facilitated trehalose transporter Tret1-like [Aricia agestis]|uniref:facilitated trehalose transporter Tret1-like n=1 Tax=Aricia agestis TaxID=91739 RepID=UPI001C202CA1|nr:facilitated trehalose transporter Tret1-like [Aricia agestis]
MGKIHQAQTAITCSLGNLIVGLLYVWPSYTLNLYTAKNTTVLSEPMSELESSLVGSIPSLGAMVGTAAIGFLLSVFGRKRGGVILALPVTISWLVVDLTTSSKVILAARFFGGLSVGAIMCHSPIYISEIAEESIRGMLTSAPVACYCLGVLFSYLLGWFFTYRYIIWINICVCLLYIALMMCLTESPVYLMRKNKEEEAAKAIAHYRGLSTSSKIVLEEVSRLRQQITPSVELVPVNTEEKPEETEKSKLSAEEYSPEPPKMPTWKLLFFSPSSRRAFTVVGLTLSLQVMMGMVAVQVYAKDIFSSAAPNLSSHMCSVLLAFVLLMGSLLSTVLTDKFGRRILLVLSSIAVALCLILMGVQLQTMIAPAWLTAVLILVYCFSFMFGAGSIPYVLLAEAFTPEVQSLASMIQMESVWFLNFFLVAVFPFMVKFFGIYGSFYSFALFAIMDLIVGLTILPETKGLTNEQIQEVFLRRRIK